MYNKNTLSLIPNLSKIAIKFIRDYFYLYNRKAERKIRRKRIYNRRIKLFISRIFLSKGEFKHTNNKVIITLYVYNKQKNNYLQKINKIKVVSNYVNRFYKKYNKKYLKKLFLYTHYRRLIYINKSRFNYTYLQYIKNDLQVIFNKNIEFNFINLKSFYLDSNIISQTILLKIRKNRRRLVKILSNLENVVTVRKKRIFLGNLIKKENLYKKVLYYNSFLYKNILNNIKYKHLAGFRLEAKGRLSRRYTASRSINKIKYKGNLLNIDSSYKGLSSELLRNNLNSNLQYTKLNSKTRIGSFGLKG